MSENQVTSPILCVKDVYMTRIYNGDRVTTVLAAFGPEALVEIEMPNSTMLRIVPRDRRLHAPGKYRSANYHQLSKRWLTLLARSGVPWIAEPQGKKVTQSPRGMFLERWPDEAWRLADEAWRLE